MNDRALALDLVLRCVKLYNNTKLKVVLLILVRCVEDPRSVSDGKLVLAQEKVVKTTQIGSEREVAAAWALFWAVAPKVNLAAVERAVEIALNRRLR